MKFLRVEIIEDNTGFGNSLSWLNADAESCEVSPFTILSVFYLVNAIVKESLNIGNVANQFIETEIALMFCVSCLLESKNEATIEVICLIGRDTVIE